MKKLLLLISLGALLSTPHSVMAIDEQVEAVVVREEATAVSAVDVRALDDLIDIPDFPDPDPEQLQIPAWKTWFIKAADTMAWTVQTGKDTLRAASNRCKRLISYSDSDTEYDDIDA